MGDDFYVEPKLIQGGLAIDERGLVSFCNDFQFAGVRRCYWVRNHRAGTVRAWHWHGREHKYVACLQGAALVGAVQVEDPKCPERSAILQRFILAAEQPVVLHIPCGWANGFKALREDTLLMFFSTVTLEESQTDDVRFDPYFWDCWGVKEY